MAIKLPDPGNGIPEQKTGNDEWTNMKIVRDNFADSSNAASRLVGTGAEQIPLSKQVFHAYNNTVPIAIFTGDVKRSCDDLKEGEVALAGSVNENSPPSSVYNLITTQRSHATAVVQTAVGYNIPDLAQRTKYLGVWSEWAMFYNTLNTTVDSNKNIKTSSPVVRVFADHLDKIHEANQLPIKYTRNGIGDYTIEGSTGLRENDWQIVIPKDDHDNQLIAFTLDDDNGTIRLKTYKRTFNMTTFMFEPDLSEPMDIPEGRWVDLHFNDLPQEQIDEPAI